MQNKKKKDTAGHDEERYQFIKEQVRPQQRKYLIKWFKRLGFLLFAAVLFGIIAGSVIVYIQNYLLRPKEVVKISTYTDVPEETPGEIGKTAIDNNTSLAKLNKITQRLAAVGEKLDTSLVGIKQRSSAQNLLVGVNSQTTAYGLLIQQTESYIYILTTNQVVEGQSTVVVQMSDNTVVEGTLLGSDTQLNLAIIRVQKSDMEAQLLSKMKVARLGSGRGLVNGTNVIAVGAPNGVLRSVVLGRITNTSINASITDGEIQLYCTDMPYTDKGNGVVLDTKGRVIGVLTTDFTEQTGLSGLSFIRISDVLNVIELLKRKQSAPYLGIEGKSLSSTVAEAHKLEKGAYVTEVYSGSPAYDGGMRVADVITRIDGDKVSTMSDIYRALLEHRPGDMVTYTISRKSGKEQFTKQLKIILE